MRVLVTGASGFLGHAVVKRFALDGHQVVALVRRPVAKMHQFAAQTVTGDLRDSASVRAAMNGVQAVCHLAGLTNVREATDDPAAYHRSNRDCTAAVLAAIADQAGRGGDGMRMVFASTMHVYGSPGQLPISEDHPPRPANSYGASKLAAERLVDAQTRAGLLGAISLRASNVAGATDGRGDTDRTRIIPRAVWVAAGHAPHVEIDGDGTAVRDYVHVADYAAACSLALSSCRIGEHRVYNLGSGIATSVLDLIQLARQISRASIPVVFRNGDPGPPVLVVDPSRIRAELGWRPDLSTTARIVADAWTAERPR
jgi:UDP-glucose 4-epimerase